MLYLMYIVVFIHFSGTLRKMDSVHSRYGLAITGLVEIIASTVCSVSICAISGFRVTMVPWYASFDCPWLALNLLQGLSTNHGRVHWRREHVSPGAQHLFSTRFLLTRFRSMKSVPLRSLCQSRNASAKAWVLQVPPIPSKWLLATLS